LIDLSEFFREDAFVPDEHSCTISLQKTSTKMLLRVTQQLPKIKYLWKAHCQQCAATAW